MLMSNLKQQNMSLHFAINSKEDKYIELESQLNECRNKLKQSSEEMMKLEDKMSLLINETNNLKDEKEDLEDKVKLTERKIVSKLYKLLIKLDNKNIITSL